MATLRLGFADTYENAKLFFTDILSRRFEVVRDDTDPDYLIFGDSNFGETHYQFTKARKIFFTGENVRPSYYTYDYAVTFDFENSSKHYRLPLYVLEMWAITKDNGINDFLHLVNKKVDIEYEWERKRKRVFAYIQSNPNCKFRTEFVDYLLHRKLVECGGPHLNNIGYVIPRNRNAKMEFFHDAYFGIAFENGSHPGYVTEKLLDCYYANTIPIYWGSDPIHRDFNIKSMIQAKDFKSFSELVDYCLDLTQNKNAYLDILGQPAFTDNIPNEYTNLNSFLDWFEAFVI